MFVYWVFMGFSPIAVSGGFSLLVFLGFSLQWLLLCSRALGRTGFSSCCTWAQQLWLLSSKSRAQQLRHTDSAVVKHVGPSYIEDQICVSCIGRQILLPLSRQGSPYIHFDQNITLTTYRLFLNCRQNVNFFLSSRTLIYFIDFKKYHKKYGTLHTPACHPCTGTILIFSVLFQIQHMCCQSKHPPLNFNLNSFSSFFRSKEL